MFDISGLALSVPRRKDIPMGTHGIVDSDGGVSGSFASTDLPDFSHWSVNYGAKVVQLKCANGMTIIFK